MLKRKKYISMALTAAMMASLLAGCGSTSDSEETDKTESTTQSESQSDEDTLQEALTSQISAEDAGEADKEETVFVVADANGNPSDVTVSTWLKNADAEDGLNDYTTLTDVENVKGYETYTENSDGTITWQANGSDIYYQGKSSDELPVDVKVTYKLDGEEIEPAELAGKSGKVTIRFDYTNNTKQTVKAGSKNVEVVSPFVMLSGMILPVDTFSNVQVTNGKVISEGSNQIVVGYAVPGFKQCLEDGIDDSKINEAIDDIDVPEYVEVTADVTDFELAMTMTIAASDLLDSDAEDAIEDAKEEADIDSIEDDVDTLSESADELEEGSGKITNGLETLKDGTYSLSTGAETLASGAASLKTYTSQLASGTSQISEAMGTLNDGITSIKTGSSKLNDGAKTLASGAKTLDTSVGSTKTAGTLANGAYSLNSGANALLSGFKGTKKTKGAVDGAKELSEGVSTLATGSETLEIGAKSVSDGVTKLVNTLTAMPEQIRSEQIKGMTTEQIETQMSQLSTALKGAYQLAVTSTSTDGKMSSEMFNGYLDSYTQLATALGVSKTLDGLETQLGSIDSNKNGVNDLTELKTGASQVASGATTLKEGLASAEMGSSSLYSGINTMYNGTKTLASGTKSLLSGVNELKKGTKSLSDGAATISTNMNTLYKGSVTLASGSSKLVTATGTLDTSASKIATGAKTLSDGAAELSSGSKTLDSGAEELVSGATTLSDGMSQFNEEGIKKITSLFAGNYEDDIDYIEALFSDDAKYTNYGGALEGTSSTVKFIYETEAVKTEDAE